MVRSSANPMTLCGLEQLAEEVLEMSFVVQNHLSDSGTSELRTPRDHAEVSVIGRCPLYRECTWDPFQLLYATCSKV